MMSLTKRGFPDCVPEYYRSQQAEAEHRLELQEKERERYRANEEKLNEAAKEGYPILMYEGYAECLFCKKRDSDTVTCENDDMGRIICLDKNCIYHQKENSFSEEDGRCKEESQSCCEFVRDNYKNQELLEELTLENAKKFARINYNTGGDAIIECMDDAQIEDVIRKFGKKGILDVMYDWYMRCEDVEKTIW